MDPLKKDYPYYTPYQFAGNSPIANIDLDGAEPIERITVLDDGTPMFDIASDWVVVMATRVPEWYSRVTLNGTASDPISRNIYSRLASGDTDFSIKGPLHAQGASVYGGTEYVDPIGDVLLYTAGGLLAAGASPAAVALSVEVAPFLAGSSLLGAGIETTAQLTFGQGNLLERARGLDLVDIGVSSIQGGALFSNAKRLSKFGLLIGGESFKAFSDASVGSGN